jgi:hypothetical protein
MRRALWSSVLCVGFLVVTPVGARSIEVESPSEAESEPAALVCTSAEADNDTEAMCGKCGDGYCNPRCGETATSCPKDCGATTATDAMCGKCGDGYCNPRCGETATSCPKDCGGSTS